MRKKIVSLLLMSAMAVSVFAGCGKSGADDDVTEFTYFITMHGSEKNDDNEVAKLIADKYGVKIKETWLTTQTAAEATNNLIAADEYPDLIDSDEMQLLLDAGALIPLDEYIDKYPDFKETWFTQTEWEKFRQPDGHIYWINPFNNEYGESKETIHNDEAFWIQVRVLEWGGYPTIQTMDEYFDLIERYLAANPTMEDGTANIGYTILCEDWRYFCLENAGQFLAGYPNDGSVLVNRAAMTVEDYNTSEDTVAYFRKLNEEYQRGIIDPESFTQTYDEYIAKLSTGCVLGMVDQGWNFLNNVSDAFKQQGLDLKGCNYVPLGLTTTAGMENRWHTYGDTVNQANGIAITKDCEDPEKAFEFLVACAMDQELHDLRFWGVKGVDYLVDESGLYYRTDEMRAKCADASYKASHLCEYSYFPQWNGTSRDGKNAMKPAEQPSEFMNGMAKPLLDCFNAYHVTTYPDMIKSVVEENAPWFPMYSYSNNFTTATPGGLAWVLMDECKHEWLPRVVMASDFDKVWADYMEAYNACNPQDFIAEMQAILDTFR